MVATILVRTIGDSVGMGVRPAGGGADGEEGRSTVPDAVPLPVDFVR
jgi:hypothetical protein